MWTGVSVFPRRRQLNNGYQYHHLQQQIFPFLYICSHIWWKMKVLSPLYNPPFPPYPSSVHPVAPAASPRFQSDCLLLTIENQKKKIVSMHI